LAFQQQGHTDGSAGGGDFDDCLHAELHFPIGGVVPFLVATPTWQNIVHPGAAAQGVGA
jgi:hypothetical protein